MVEDRDLILQLTDSLTRRKAALRINPEDRVVNLGQLLDKYLWSCPTESLLQTGAIDLDSARTLQAFKDLVYLSNDRGQLTGMFSGIVFKQQERPVGLEEYPITENARAGETEVSVIDLTIDRISVGYDRNWAGFHCRRWDSDPTFFSSFVHAALEEAYGPARAESILRLDSEECKLHLIHAVGRRIWNSDFENYSRFIGDRQMFKTGDETVRNIANGSGGICTEKVQALKFLTDHYGLVSEYLIAGDNARDPAPVNKLRELLTTFDFRFSKRYMRYWQHAALLYRVDGIPVLVDATNGNIPFLFVKGVEAERILGYVDKPPIAVKMVEAEENYYYHRVPQDIPENLFFALESWLSDTDMVQVFENELGLYLSHEFYVMPLPYRNSKEYERLRQEYLTICRRANFYGEVNREWTLDSPLGRELTAANPKVAAKVLAAKDGLLQRYNEWDRPGHDAGLVVIRLAGG
jgi:hypothetical protein